MQRRHLLSLLLLLVMATVTCGQTTKKKRISKLPDEAFRAAQACVVAKGLKVDLFAAEPLLANPVAFCIDERGRFFVCETFRISRGVEDNRDHESWIDDDLASQTVDDRLALYHKHLKDDIKKLQGHQDRIRRIEDTNGDGRADKSRVYVDGFGGVLEGTGAGVLARHGMIYYTCIPRLWTIRDENGDGKADKKTALHDGYGVRVSLFGHDLHGLCLGLDGRLYFSIGDRGYNVTSRVDQRRVADPESGAVFRCELDGSNLEVFATGLRNPQDLEFDDFGNLFTADNNSDSGDLARWVHVLQGGDSGWRMAYQYMADRGPWNRERLWEPFHVGQPAYIVPPVANIGDGPAGITYYPGTGLSDAYRGNFFLCDFRAEAALSGVRTFKMKPSGATYELIDPEMFVWNCVPTDIQFGLDGSVYLTDWVRGWKGTGKGRIFRVWDTQSENDPALAEVQDFLSKGLASAPAELLGRLLAHPDRRLRLEAQLQLVANGDGRTLATVAQTSNVQLAKMHGIWGLGQIARGGGDGAAAALREVAALIRDTDEEVRAASATVLGDVGQVSSTNRLVALLDDEHSRVRYAAALALGKIGATEGFAPILKMLSENGDQDPALRHAGIMGLAGCGDDEQLGSLSQHPHRSVRLAAVVALRRRKSPALAEFLGDRDTAIVSEAARAIYDVPVPPALPKLASLIRKELNDDALIRRVLNANFRIGSATAAQALVDFAVEANRPVHSRLQALDRLGDWATPPSRDPVLGMWRPLMGDRDFDVAKDALRPVITELLEAGHEVRSVAVRLASRMQLAGVSEHLVKSLWDTERSGKERAGALLALATFQPDDLREVVGRAIEDDEDRVRAAARIVLTNIAPEEAVNLLWSALKSGTQLERQSAVHLLSRVGTPASDQALLTVLKAQADDQVPDYVRLDVYEAARRRAPHNRQIADWLDDYEIRWADDPVAPYRDALVGGDAARGERLFFQRIALQCSRCHKVNDAGGNIGPELTTIAKDRSREYLLESIVVPNKDIAEGFESVNLVTHDGQVVVGVLRQRTEDKLRLVTAEGDSVTIDTDEVDQIDQAQSVMPENLVTQLSLMDLRDLLEYMSGLK